MVYDVIVAGAGPVGLFLACELRLAKCSVLVLERETSPLSPLKCLPFGMRGLWGPSVEAFYRRGMLDALLASVAQMEGLPKPGTMAPEPGRTGPAGHFAGIQFDYANIDTSRWPYRVRGPADAQVGITMESLEHLLEARAHELGVEIVRGQVVDGFDVSADEVVVRSSTRTSSARWLVGCDGGRSAVRKLAGFDFVGTEPEITGYSVMAELEPSPLPLGRHYTPHGMFTQWKPGVLSIADFDGGAFHRRELTIQHVQDVLRRVSGVDVTLSALQLAATWTDRSEQVTTYRKGRVLLAGDSAHVHSPLGGQGLNLGLGDAMNLGWKLAATIHGEASNALLDSYTAERHPVGARVLEWTRAQVAVMRPSSRALEGVMRDLVATRDGATYFAERVWGVTLRYDLGELHPLVGRSCPDFELQDGTRLGELLRKGRGVLLDFGRTLEGAAVHARYVGTDARERLGLSAVLVRPDGFVAWASDGPASIEEVERAARRWFTLAG